MEVTLKSIDRETAVIAVIDSKGGTTELYFPYRDIPECRWEAEITEVLGIPEVPDKVLRQMHKVKIKA